MESNEDIERVILTVLSHDWMTGMDTHKAVEWVYQHAVPYRTVYDALGKLESEGKIESEGRDGRAQGNLLGYSAYRLTGKANA